MTRPALRGEPGRAPGLLGADLERADDGWRVARVLPAESSAPRRPAPLAAPGVDVRAGDVILDVDGRPVDPRLGTGAAAGRRRRTCRSS